MAKYTQSLTSAICELIGKYNLTVTETCRLMRVSRNTFYTWYKEKADFRAAVDKAYNIRDQFIPDPMLEEQITISRKSRQM